MPRLELGPVGSPSEHDEYDANDSQLGRAFTESPRARSCEASAGRRQALESLVAAIQDDVYGLAIRFLGHPADAADACQEILLRVVTGLSTFRAEGGFRTWVYRVAANHLMDVRRQLRRPELSLDEAEATLSAAVQASLRNAAESDPLVVEEMRLACAHGMLLCLDREHRLAYILGTLLELPGDEAASILEVPEPTFRKRLQRARERMRAHLSPYCGLVDPEHPCRCDRMAPTASSAGVIDVRDLVYATHRRGHSLAAASERLLETTELLRGSPAYQAPDEFVRAFRALLERLPGLQ